jgi:hypothetical protein
MNNYKYLDNKHKKYCNPKAGLARAPMAPWVEKIKNSEYDLEYKNEIEDIKYKINDLIIFD